MPKRLPGTPSDPGLDVAFWSSRRHGRSDRALTALDSYDAAVLATLAVGLRVFAKGLGGSSPDAQPKSTHRVYQSGVKSWVAFAQESGIALLSAEVDDLTAWVRHLEAGGGHQSTVISYLAGVRWLYAGLRRLRLLDGDPTLGVQPGQDDRAAWEKRDEYPQEDAASMMAEAVASGDLALALAVSLGADVGLRASEIVTVCFKDFDLAERMLHVRRAKGGKERFAALLPRAVERFEALLPVPDQEARVYPFTSTTLRKRLAKLCAVVGVKYRAVHSLRHTHGMMLDQSGVPITVVAAQMGHVSVRSSEIYVKLKESRRIHHIIGSPRKLV